ncbi:c-type cytochrome [Rhodoferax saidenbachensis]|uniref:c-type cytochrome n=1 Tax=Rhodoferax saidenbachensis TaxID=1484693 RepID=UPI00286B783F|nr:c-type cytochrome [Rhodoferax saidenbachensis]
MSKALLCLCALLLAVGVSHANDVSPYKVGDALSTEDAQAMLSRYASRPLQPWREPDPAKIPAGPEGDAIREGIDLMLHTSQRVGNRSPDENKRLNWNSLNCVNCHQAGPSGLPGTKKFALALVNAVNDYPRFDTKSGKIISLEQRALGMFGSAPVKMTVDKPEFQAIMAYLRWLNSEAQPERAMVGVGLLPMKPIGRAADPVRGKVLYASKCQSCHGADATGQRKPDFDTGGGYLFPPLAGSDTYDNAGHMFAIPLFARYIRASMPFGTQADRPQLTPAQALDIAAYINDDSTLRGQNPNRIKLYTDAALRPQGFAIPEHFVDQPKAYQRAKFGPFKNVNENY